MADRHWSDDPATVADVAQRARRAVAARIGLDGAAVRADVLKHLPDIGRARSAVAALVERAYTLDLLARG